MKSAPRRAHGRQHVVGTERRGIRRQRPVAVRGHQIAQLGQAAVVAVAEDQAAEVHLQLIERHVRDRALGKVAANPVVADLLGRLDFDGHPAVAHRQMLRDGEGAERAGEPSPGCRAPGTERGAWSSPSVEPPATKPAGSRPAHRARTIAGNGPRGGAHRDHPALGHRR